jgi:hypothetical protein
MAVHGANRVNPLNGVYRLTVLFARITLPAATLILFPPFSSRSYFSPGSEYTARAEGETLPAVLQNHCSVLMVSTLTTKG